MGIYTYYVFWFFAATILFDVEIITALSKEVLNRFFNVWNKRRSQRHLAQFLPPAGAGTWVLRVDSRIWRPQWGYQGAPPYKSFPVGGIKIFLILEEGKLIMSSYCYLQFKMQDYQLFTWLLAADDMNFKLKIAYYSSQKHYWAWLRLLSHERCTVRNTVF